MTDKYLYINGCSYVEGSELFTQIYPEEMNKDGTHSKAKYLNYQLLNDGLIKYAEANRDNCFGKLLSNKLGRICINRGLGSKSNQQIALEVINDADKYKDSDIVFIVCFTDLLRNPMVVNNGIFSTHVRKKTNNNIFNIQDLLIMNNEFYFYLNQLINYALHVKTVHDKLLDSNRPFIILRSFASFASIVNNFNKYEKEIEVLNKSEYSEYILDTYNYVYSFERPRPTNIKTLMAEDYLLSLDKNCSKDDIRCYYGHMGVKAHIKASEILYNLYINKLFKNG